MNSGPYGISGKLNNLFLLQLCTDLSDIIFNMFSGRTWWAGGGVRVTWSNIHNKNFSLSVLICMVKFTLILVVSNSSLKQDFSVKFI